MTSNIYDRRHVVENTETFYDRGSPHLRSSILLVKSPKHWPGKNQLVSREHSLGLSIPKRHFLCNIIDIATIMG